MGWTVAFAWDCMNVLNISSAVFDIKDQDLTIPMDY